jgi:hypothetical protein
MSSTHGYSQTCIGGGTIQITTPEPSLSPTQKKVLNCIRKAGRGLTYPEIRQRLALAGFQEVDPRIRELRQLGYVESCKDKADGLTRFYPTQKREAIK